MSNRLDAANIAKEIIAAAFSNMLQGRSAGDGAGEGEFLAKAYSIIHAAVLESLQENADTDQPM